MPTNNNKYQAFISYRHADNIESGRQWASWLHQAIETYEVPEDLVGSINQRGDEVQSRIFPVFRDEEALPADADLASAITRALDDSGILIVLCSPNARASTYVSDEIDYYKQLGHSHRIIAAIIDGEPNTSWDENKRALGFSKADECFPLPLQYVYDDQGSPTREHAEPIAADFRVNHDGKKQQGWTSPRAYRGHLKQIDSIDKSAIDPLVEVYQKQLHLMLLKIIAGILAVPLDELTRRDKAYQLEIEKNKAKRLKKWLTAVGFLAIAAIVAGIYAFSQQQIADKQKQLAIVQRDKAEALLDNVRQNLKFMNYDLRDVLLNYVPSAERIKVIDRIDRLNEALSKYGGGDSDSDKRELATILIQKADIILENSDLNPEESFALYQRALDISLTLLQSNPNNMQYMLDLTISYNKLGDIQLILGNSTAAFELFQASRDLCERLLKLVPGEPTYLRQLSIAHERNGSIELLRGNIQIALSEYESSLLITKQLVKQSPKNNKFKRNLSVAHNKIGDIQTLLGNSSFALKSYQEGQGITQYLVDLDPKNIQYAQDLAFINERLGSTYVILGQTNKALKSYQNYEAVNKLLLELDPKNIHFQMALSTSYEKMADVWVLLGANDKALNAYQQSLNIRQKLAKKQPDNKHFMRGISLAHNHLGDVQLLMNNTEQALVEYQASLKIDQKLTNLDPDNINLRRDLSISHEKIGNIHQLRGNIKSSLVSYQTSHQIALQLAQETPSNSQLQRDLSVTYERLGDTYVLLADIPSALNAYQAGHVISERLAIQDITNTRIQRDLANSNDRLGNLYLREHDFQNALTHYKTSFEIRQKLIKLDVDNAGLQRDIFVSYWKLYKAYRFSKEGLKALEMITKAHEQLLFMQENTTLLDNDIKFIESTEQKIISLKKELNL